MSKKKILVGIMNWGLGHATRCIPVIRELENRSFVPLLASDGSALMLLQKEFPHLRSFALPSYNIQYTKNPGVLKWKLLSHTPHIMKTIRAEKKITEALVQKESISGIISDNRFGVRSKHIPSAYITHQLTVFSGSTTYISSKIHQHYIRKFDECWIPDSPHEENLSGTLGHSIMTDVSLEYMGLLSRFQKKETPIEYDFLVLLSGPEPQRTLLENILLKELRDTGKRIFFVRGIMNKEKIVGTNPNLVVKNHLYGDELEQVINSSSIVICRSGYSSFMDLAKLEKKAFLIPTPGQPEQEYLARRISNLGIAPYCDQSSFKLSHLNSVINYSGFQDIGFRTSFDDLFSLFQRK